jgi:hypothetical protein
LPHKTDTSTPSSGCTPGCTSKPSNEDPGTVEALAAAILRLSAEERARLVALILAGPEGGSEGM